MSPRHLDPVEVGGWPWEEIPRSRGGSEEGGGGRTAQAVRSTAGSGGGGPGMLW